MLTKKKKRVFIAITIVLTMCLILILGELMIRFVKPQVYLYPRWEYSSDYGSILFKNTKMHNIRPGKWEFVYTVNDYRYRGELIPLSNTYPKRNIVVLGDSYGFGTGVNDGEEFSSVIAKNLERKYDVVNLSVGGWGITQQIRRFYEFGQLYRPDLVILQFCSNDLDDNFRNKVTVIENGRFKFVKASKSIFWVNKYLSNSIIQKSQIYNMLRNGIYRSLQRQVIDNELNKLDRSFKEVPPKQAYHLELLELFAKDLNQKGIRLILISVNDHLDNLPAMKKKVMQLDSLGILEYGDTSNWFENVEDYGSPEGHNWGTKGHAIIGDRLTQMISEN